MVTIGLAGIFFEPQNIEQGISNVEVPFSYATNSVVLIALLDRKA
jgi:hypothetical protein